MTAPTILHALHVHRLEDLRPGLLDEVEGYFRHYNALSGCSFTPLGRGGPERAREIAAKRKNGRRGAAGRRRAAS